MGINAPMDEWKNIKPLTCWRLTNLKSAHLTVNEPSGGSDIYTASDLALDEVDHAAQRRAKRQFLSCGFVEYFCVAKPQKRDLKTVQPRSGDAWAIC